MTYTLTYFIRLSLQVQCVSVLLNSGFIATFKNQTMKFACFSPLTTDCLTFTLLLAICKAYSNIEIDYWPCMPPPVSVHGGRVWKWSFRSFITMNVLGFFKWNILHRFPCPYSHLMFYFETSAMPQCEKWHSSTSTLPCCSTTVYTEWKLTVLGAVSFWPGV